MKGWWFKLCSVLLYGTSVSVVSLKNSILLPLILARCAQELFSEWSKRDSIHSTFYIRFYTLHMYMYIIQNRQWHLKKSTVLLHCPSLLWKPLKKFTKSHNLKDGSRLTFHYFWNNYDRINHPWHINYLCNGDLSTPQLQWRIQRVYWSPIWNCNPYWISFENFCISSSIPYARLIMMSFIV